MLEIGTKAPEFTLPDQNGEMKSLKDFRGKKLNIKVLNPNGSESGYKSMTLNGTVMEDNYIPFEKLSEVNEIILTM